MVAGRPRTSVLLVVLQFAIALAAAVLGGGYDLSPAVATRHPITAPWDPTLTTAVTMLSFAAAGTIGAAGAWLALHAERLALALSALLVAVFGVANVVAVWAYVRADPPLPTTWEWLRALHLTAAFLVIAWISVAVARGSRLRAPAAHGPG